MNLDIRVHSEVISIDADAKQVTVRDLQNQRIYQESYDDLILSVGASPIRPKIPEIGLPGLFPVRSIEDVEAIQDWLVKHNPRNAVVAGGGFIGLEMAEQLPRRGLNVTLIDGKKQVLTPIDPEMAALVHAELLQHGVKLVLGEPIKEFHAPTELKTNKVESPLAISSEPTKSTTEQLELRSFACSI